MSGNIIQLNEDLIKNNLKNLVRDSVEETLNALLDHEADSLPVLASMSGRETVRATVPVITSGISARLPVKSSCACPNSRASSSRRPSSNATNAVNARSRKPLLRCTLPAYPCAVSKISPNCFGAQRSLRAPSATSTRRHTSKSSRYPPLVMKGGKILWRIVKLSATPLRNRPHMVFCSQGTS